MNKTTDLVSTHNRGKRGSHRIVEGYHSETTNHVNDVVICMIYFSLSPTAIICCLYFNTIDFVLFRLLPLGHSVFYLLVPLVP